MVAQDVGILLNKTTSGPKRLKACLDRFGPYALALALVATTAVIVGLTGKNPPFLVMMMPVMLAAWAGGFGPGVLSTILGGAVTFLYLGAPVDLVPTITSRYAIFAAEGLAISLICGSLHRGRKHMAVSLGKARDALARLDSANAQLTANEEQLSLALEAGGMRVWEWDLRRGAMASVCGRGPRQGTHPDQPPTIEAYEKIVHPDDLTVLRRAIDRALVTSGEFAATYRVPKADGIHWWRSAGRVRRDESGEPDRLIGATFDVTETKRQELELREQRARLRFLVDHMPAVFWSVDRDMRIIEAAGAVGSHPVMMDEAAVGRRLDEYFAAGDPSGAVTAATRAALVGEARSCELRWHERDFNVQLKPLRSLDGSVVGALAFALDVSEAKRAERHLVEARQQAEAANQAKSSFLAAISHELRTPLAVMLGFADLALASDQGAAERERWVRTIKKNAEQLLQLVNDLLDLSKAEAGQLPIEALTTPLADVLQDVAGTLGFQAQAKGITFSLSSDADLPRTIITDPVRLRQILVNVGGNAVKFTSEGEVKMQARWRPPATGRAALLEVTISDTGIGMSAEQQQRLFRPFAQGDAATARRFGGSGLGLVLSRQLARALGGDIVIASSEPGKGSTFVLTVAADAATLAASAGMPAAAGPRQAAVLGAPAPRPAALSGRGRLAGMRLLVVEDFDDIRQLLLTMLSQAGAAVDLAESGESGVSMALGGDYDAVLMDIQMPGVDGVEATSRLRRRGYERPIIALTAHALKADRERTMRSGFNGYLTKPVDRQALLAALAELRRPSLLH